MAFQLAGTALRVMDSALQSSFKCQNTTPIDRLASSESISMSRKVSYGWLLRYWGKHGISWSRGIRHGQKMRLLGVT